MFLIALIFHHCSLLLFSIRREGTDDDDKVYQELSFFLSEQGNNKQYAVEMICDVENKFIFYSLQKSRKQFFISFNET